MAAEETIGTSDTVEKTYEQECIDWDMERSLRISDGFWFVRSKPRPSNSTYYPEKYEEPDRNVNVIVQFMVNRVVDHIDRGVPLRTFEQRFPPRWERDERVQREERVQTVEEDVKRSVDCMVTQVVQHMEKGRSLNHSPCWNGRKRVYRRGRGQNGESRRVRQSEDGESKRSRQSEDGAVPSLSSLFEFN